MFTRIPIFEIDLNIDKIMGVLIGIARKCSILVFELWDQCVTQMKYTSHYNTNVRYLTWLSSSNRARSGFVCLV